jgi:hypothetical protein
VNKSLVFVWLLLLSSLSQAARADLITYSANFGPQTFSLGTKVGGTVGSGISTTLNWDASLGVNFSFPKFDPTLGTLNDVRLTFAGATGLTADIRFSNNQLPPFNVAGINVNMTTIFAFNDATNAVASTGSNFINNTIDATSSSTPFNFNVGSAGVTGTLVSVPVSNRATYLGSGTVTLPMNVQFLAQATTSNGAFFVTPFPILALSPAQLTYDFTPVPEPGALSLCVLGAVFIATVRNRKKANHPSCSQAANVNRSL